MSVYLRVLPLVWCLVLPAAVSASWFEQLVRTREGVRDNLALMWQGMAVPVTADAKTEKDFHAVKADYLLRLYLPDAGSCDPETVALVRECLRRYDYRWYDLSWHELLPQGETAVKRYPNRPELKALYGMILQLAGRDAEAEKLLKSLLNDADAKRKMPPLQRFFGYYHLAEAQEKLHRDGDDNYRRARNEIVAAVKQGSFNDLSGARIVYRLLVKADIRDTWKYFDRETAAIAGVDPWLKAMVKARLYLEKAWAVSEDDRDGGIFDRNVLAARKQLIPLWQAHPELPEAASLMISAATASSQPENSRLLWFRRAVRAQFDYPYAYELLLWALGPDWDGSDERMLAFGLAALNTARFDTAVPGYYFHALVDVAGAMPVWDWTSPFREPAVKERLVKLFDGQLKASPPEAQRQLILARYAVAMLACGDFAAADRLLHQVKPDFDFHRLGLPGRLDCDRAAWDYELQVRRGPTGAVLDSVARLMNDDHTQEAVGVLVAAVRQAADPRLKRYLLDILGGLLLDREIGEIPSCHPVFHEAVLTEAPEIVETMLDCGADFKAAACQGRTPLFFAARNNRQTRIAELLLKNGAPVDAAGPDHYTPLMGAARNDNAEMLELLLKSGASVNAADLDDGWTALHYAVQYCDHMEGLQTLIRHGAGLNSADREHGDTPLLLACRLGRFEAAKLLLENGAGINGVNADGMTALHLAVREKQPETVKLLLERGADRNIRDKAGKTAAEYARSRELRRLFAVPPAPAQTSLPH